MYHSVGGTGYEPGGPGMTYFHGNHVRNLRLDNKCQRPRVTEPAFSSANQAQFESYKRNGNAAYIGHYLVIYIYIISLNWFTFINCQKVTVDYPCFSRYGESGNSVINHGLLRMTSIIRFQNYLVIWS